MTLTEFLLARIAEDEERHGHHKVRPSDYGDFKTPDGGCVPCDLAPPRECRVLAECEAKRGLITEANEAMDANWPVSWIERYLAQPYADHPDYRDEWRVEMP